jgi:hypothetical protein
MPVLLGEGRAPVVPVLVPAVKKKADESIPDTKGRESWTPKHFSLQIGSFLGTATGGHDGDRGPLWPAPSSPPSPAFIVGEGHAPVVGVLVPAVKQKSQMSASPPPKDVNHGPPRSFP